MKTTIHRRICDVCKKKEDHDPGRFGPCAFGGWFELSRAGALSTHTTRDICSDACLKRVVGLNDAGTPTRSNDAIIADYIKNAPGRST